jgi:hypothetical protein
MTSQHGEVRHAWRRGFAGAMAGSAIAAALVVGVGAPTATSEPANTTTEAEAPPTPTMTADEALAIIQSEYDTGAGGGQVSNLVHDVLALRAQGFRPSNANKVAIQEALDKRPNQTPLVEALKATLAYQRKLQAQAAMAQQAQSEPGYNMGQMGQPPTAPGQPGVAVGGGPGAPTINQPIG